VSVMDKTTVKRKKPSPFPWYIAPLFVTLLVVWGLLGFLVYVRADLKRQIVAKTGKPNAFQVNELVGISFDREAWVILWFDTPSGVYLGKDPTPIFYSRNMQQGWTLGPVDHQEIREVNLNPAERAEEQRKVGSFEIARRLSNFQAGRS
jgi:hypothetical protein